MPLKKFLNKNTLNSKVNNWAVGISPFRITFEYIKGIKNTLADMMSRWISIDPDTNPDEVTLTYFDPKDPGGDVDRLLSLLDGEHYEVISSLQDQDTFCH